MTIVEFLTARLDEDEQVAIAALDRQHPHEERGRQMCGSERCTHDLRHHPRRVLTEVATKRYLVTNASEWIGNPDDTFSGRMAAAVWGNVLKALAWVYGDHPDYRQEWTQ